MSNWFIITSAINVDYGIFTFDEKVEQTKQTIKSIRKYCTDSKIVILEASPKSLSKEFVDELHGLADMYVDFSGDEKIQVMHKELNIFAVKSPGENYIVWQFLNAQNFIQSTDRVYKISGRYYLTENFDQQFHESQVGKFVFKKRQTKTVYYDAQTKDEYLPFTEYQYKTRLYSLCGSLIPYYVNKCYTMMNFFYEVYGKIFTDIEHVMYHHLDRDFVNEIDTIGVAGIAADRNEKVDE